MPGSTIGYLSSIASLITGTSKFVQKKDLLQIKLSISGKASWNLRHSKNLGIWEFGLSIPHTAWSFHIFHSILVHKVADGSFSYLSTHLTDIQSPL